MQPHTTKIPHQSITTPQHPNGPGIPSSTCRQTRTTQPCSEIRWVVLGLNPLLIKMNAPLPKPGRRKIHRRLHPHRTMLPTRAPLHVAHPRNLTAHHSHRPTPRARPALVWCPMGPGTTASTMKPMRRHLRRTRARKAESRILHQHADRCVCGAVQMGHGPEVEGGTASQIRIMAIARHLSIAPPLGK